MQLMYVPTGMCGNPVMVRPDAGADWTGGSERVELGAPEMNSICVIYLLKLNLT